MRAKVAGQLLELNREFYQTFAEPFSVTRGRVQPGVRRVIETLPAGGRILDLGCGNGELGREIQRSGWDGQYIGLDFSPGLLANAAGSGFFIQADLTQADWPAHINVSAGFDRIFSFAALHHIPGEALRQQLIDQVRSLLAAQGLFIHSNWQFLNSPRLTARIQDWAQIGLTTDDVDPGDYLLDWRSGGTGLRYVHHFDVAELSALAEKSRFQVLQSFYSDGASGDLGLYQIWQRVPRTQTLQP